ncbi:MAG: hypothetical protein BMS9Abin03_226 [Thermodesulfobacteriota bacterium]|nr:MAG: hypothetical protein BMS9Abin03_226 [Thermodesulfobacteriota bacterium]
MNTSDLKRKEKSDELGPSLHNWPAAGKVLVTMIIVMMSLGFISAAGQIIVHDIIPTFKDNGQHKSTNHENQADQTAMRGDLFSDASAEEKTSPFYQTDEFVFALKFTHIHIFGMSAIFILMGILVLFLDLSQRNRIRLIVLPFIGIIIDLTSVWLKLFIHPAFFWLHIPGGLLFGTVFAVDSVLMLSQMWSTPSKP